MWGVVQVCVYILSDYYEEQPRRLLTTPVDNSVEKFNICFYPAGFDVFRHAERTIHKNSSRKFPFW
jgi:hypothetical protein